MSKKERGAYAKAGVNIEAATQALDLMKEHIQSTHNKNVIGPWGLFAGFIDVSFLKDYRNPVLVQSADGVGDKPMVAEMMDQYTIGQDIVNHCVNDILVHRARPISFLDCLASAKLKPEVMKKIAAEMAIACRAVDLPIIGGEIAEMPGVYRKGNHDVVGFITGVVERDEIIDGSKIEEGDVLIGLASNKIHTSGYSLALKALFETAGYKVSTFLPELNCTIGEELLKIHKCYFYSLASLLWPSDVEIHGIAHITGGGFYDNIGRLLRDGLCAEIFYQWKIPPIFRLIQKIENVSDLEMRKVFNLGIGMVLIVSPKDVSRVVARLIQRNEAPKRIGEIKKTLSEKVIFTY